MDKNTIEEYGLIVVSTIVGAIVLGFIVYLIKSGGALSEFAKEYGYAIGG